MKALIYILIFIVVFLYVMHRESKIKDLKKDLIHIENTIDIKVRKEIVNAKKQATDSLLSEFNSLPPDTVIKKEIQYRYEKITDTVLVYPADKQLEYVARELYRLYPN